MITDPQAILFANEQARRVADLYAQLYYAARIVQDVWDAQGINAVVPSNSEVIEDGSATDGRAPITGAMVNNLITQLGQFAGDLEANSNLKLAVLLKIAVHPEG